MGNRRIGQRRRQNRQILFGNIQEGENISDSEVADQDADENSQSDDGVAPYSTDYVLQYCQKHWSSWVQQTHQELRRYQQELTPRSSPQLANAVMELEEFYHQMVRVSLNLVVHQPPSHSQIF